jgi:hypothetical protein
MPAVIAHRRGHDSVPEAALAGEVQMDLKETLLAERLKLYATLRGGYGVPLAGAIYWGVLCVIGHFTTLQNWNLIAFIGSGMIFPVAVVLSKLLRVDFMKAKGPVDSVLAPAFIGMLMFWPSAFITYQIMPQLVPLILAIGMAAHWPVIGWSYGRTPIYAAHAIVRALAVTAIWIHGDDFIRITLLPGAVSLLYIVTVIALFIDSGAVKKRLGL